MRRLGVLFVLGVSIACAQQPQLRLIETVRGLTSPVDIQFEQEGQRRMFVVEQAGRIRIVANGQLLATPLLDIRGRVASGGERGLLGMALPPGFAQKQYFYVNYTRLNGDTVIARFRVTADANIANPDSQETILEIAQPASNHNGGQIRFGPDGYLYIGMGDGGGGNDQFQNGQNKRSLLGKMLRIDVESGVSPYTIPPTNPFVNDASFRPEIWAWGLRNPWRFSFDRQTGDLWIGDVGQGRAEEINFQPASSKGGENYGWPIMEGLQCLTGNNCDRTGLTFPVHEYLRNVGTSVTGGFVYRATTSGMPRGGYIFADYVSGRIWRLTRSGNPETVAAVDALRGPGFNISTFGEDASGDLFLANYSGILYRLDFPSAVNAASFVPGVSPGSASTVFAFGLRDSTEIVAAQTLPLPTALGGLQLFLGDRALPLYAVTDRQINFQLPFDLPSGVAVTLTIRRDGQVVTDLSADVGSGAPGVYTYSGTDTAIVAHSVDFTLVDEARPAERGEYITFYVSGLGPVDPTPDAGSPTPLDRLYRARALPVVTIGGVACPVEFAGLAPGFVGVYQVNVRVAATVPSGVQDLVVSIPGGAVAGHRTKIRIR